MVDATRLMGVWSKDSEGGMGNGWTSRFSSIALVVVGWVGGRVTSGVASERLGLVEGRFWRGRTVLRGWAAGRSSNERCVAGTLICKVQGLDYGFNRVRIGRSLPMSLEVGPLLAARGHDSRER